MSVLLRSSVTRCRLLLMLAIGVTLFATAPAWSGATAQAQQCVSDDPPCPQPPPLSVGVQGPADTVRSAPVTLSFSINGVGTGTLTVTATLDGAPAPAPSWQYGSNGTSATGYVGVWPASDGVHTVVVNVCESGRSPCASDGATLIYKLFNPPTKAQPIVRFDAGSQTRRSLIGCAGCAYTELSYSTPAYRSLDQDRSLTLVYSSALSAPQAQVVLDVDPNSATTPTKIQLELFDPSANNARVGLITGSDIYFSAHQGFNRVTGIVDATALPTSVYKWTAVVRNWYPDGTTLETPATVKALTVNHTTSPFGRGWSIAGLQTLHLPLGENGDAMFVENGRAVVFTNCGQGCWTAPSDESSSFYWGTPTRLRRHYQDGTDVEFDAATLRVAEVRDRTGLRTQYEYDGSGRPWHITDPAGQVTTITWAAEAGGGQAISITTPGNRTSVVHVNAAGELTQIDDPDGVRALAATYSGGRIVTATNRIGATTDYGYDRYGALASVTAPSILTDDLGWTRPVTTLTSREIALLDSAGVSGKGSATNPVRFIAPDSAWTTIRSPRSGVMRVLSNGAGDMKKSVTIDAAGKADSTIIGYDYALLPKTVWSSNGTNMEYGWTGALLTQIVDNVTHVTTDIGRNALGQPTTRTVNQILQEQNFYSADAASGLDSVKVGSSVSRFTHDTWGRTLTAIDAGQHQTSYSYQTSGFQNVATVTKNGGTTSFAYDVYGRPGTVTNPAGQSTTMGYDALNRAQSVTAPGRGTSTWAYNDASRTYTFTDGKLQQYTTVANALGAAISTTGPANAALSDQYRYDSDGNLSSSTTRGQRSVQIDRDVLGRPVHVRVGGTIVSTFAYDTARKWTAYSNAESSDTVYVDGNGRVTRQTTLRGSQRYAAVTTYGARGQKRSLTISSPQWASSITSEFDVDSLLRPDYVGTFDGSWTPITYNQDQRPQTISFPQSGATRRRQTLSYTGSDQLSSSTSNVAPDVLSWSYNYDVLERLSLLAQGEGTYAAVRTADYDAAGRLGHWADNRTVDLPPQWVCDDPSSTELTNCYWYYGTESQVVRDSTYTYDLVGNRTDLPATVQAGNRLTYFNGYTMGYDDDGNLVSKTGNGVNQSFSWNALGQLESATTNGVTTSYGYDALGRRIRKTVNGVPTQFLYDGDNLIAQLTAAGVRQLEFTYYPGVDSPHSVRESATGNLYYYATSQPGNVIALVNRYNQVVNRYEYAPFGQELSKTEQLVQPFRFAGRELDSETGLYYNRARYYDPSMGRFISEDPIGLNGGVNQYAYAGNDPVNENDPFGLDHSKWRNDECAPGTSEELSIDVANSEITSTCVASRGGVRTTGLTGPGRDGVSWGNNPMGAFIYAGQLLTPWQPIIEGAASVELALVSSLSWDLRATTTVIGRYPAYLQMARATGAHAFDVGERFGRAFPSLTGAMNRAYVSARAAMGDDFRLALQNPHGDVLGVWTQVELGIIEAKGYVQSGLWWIKP